MTAAAPRYTTEAEVRLDLRAPTSSDAKSWDGNTFDSTIVSCITSAEALIDDYCGWSFDAPTSTDPQERVVVFDRRWMGDYIRTDPAARESASVSVSGILGTDTVTLDDDDWRWAVEPAATGDAWRHIELTRRYRGPVKISTVWGWPSVPTPVKLAARRWSVHLFKQLSSPLGAELLGEEVVRLSNIPAGVKSLLQPYAETGGPVVF